MAALLLFLCAVLFGTVLFVRFLCYFDMSVSLGDFASAEATGALPLDPATFVKVDETFIFLAVLTNLLQCYSRELLERFILLK